MSDYIMSAMLDLQYYFHTSKKSVLQLTNRYKIILKKMVRKFRDFFSTIVPFLHSECSLMFMPA